LKKISVHIWLICLTINLFWFSANSQDIPSNIKVELTSYETKIEQYHKENNPQLELEFLNKAAFLCWNNQINIKAIDYFKRAIGINDQLGNTNGVILATNYVGMIYDEIQDYNSAVNYFKKGLDLNKKLKNKQNIASSYNYISQSYQQLPDYEQSNKWALEGVEIAKELNDLKMLRSFYGILANNFQSIGNSEKSIKYFELFASIDKFLKKEEIKDIKHETATQVQQAEQEKEETKQELVIQTDKLKETKSSLAYVEEVSREQKMQLELQESKIREQEAELKFERLVRNTLTGGIIGILMIFSVLVILYRKIRSQKTKIEEQRDKLDFQNQHINSSIQYAQNIQRAILPVKNQINNLFESFILYRPKDIVSGDFYWFTKVNNIAFLAVVDCTGHGVPGAFMSMIGSSHLNEIVIEKQITDPAKILSLLDKKIIVSLRQAETENNDGMDVCFISINLKSNEITFSGAKRPLFIYKNKTSEFDEIKGDRISIGGIRKGTNEEFNNHIIKAQKGDILYLSSDGLTDQNNSERKRFGRNKLKEIILNNVAEPMEKQKVIIEKALDEFQQDEEQRDDITLIGIKIN
jgi:serine phosphatase RsbU (regulator of sigma subunit)